MILNALGILTIGASGIWLWPLTRRLLRPLNDLPYYNLLTLIVGVGLSLGSLSILMMWIGLLPGNWLRAAVVLPIPWVGLAISIVVIAAASRSYGILGMLRQSWERVARATVGILGTLRQTRERVVPATIAVANRSYIWLGLICIGGIIPIALNPISYPFYTFDVLARYAPNARLLFTAQHIPTALTGYPLGVQMLYTFGFMAAGSVNDHFAGIYVAVLSAGMLGAVWLAARMLFSERVAWAAAMLTLSASVFVNWSTSGYIDVPDGFYHGLTFALALLWLRDGKVRYALLAGLLGGLALWVKQSSLVLIPALGILPLLRLQWPLEWKIVRREAGLGLLALAALLAVAAPWYVRSYLLVGLYGAFPEPGYYDSLFVDRSLAALIDFWARRSDWGLPFAITALIGGALWLAAFVRPTLKGDSESRGSVRRAVLLWCAFVVPYHVIWWWQYTYQSRYLLTSLTMYAALAGFAVDWLIARVAILRRAPAWIVILLSAALVLSGVRTRLGVVYHLATDPFQTDDAKLSRLSPDAWPLSKYIRETAPPGAKLYAMDASLAYWLYDYSLRVGYPTSLDELRGYDYFIVAPWGKDVLAKLDRSPAEIDRALSDPAMFTQLYRSGENGQVLYSINFR